MSAAADIRDDRTLPFFHVDNSIIATHGRQIGPYGIAVYNALAMHAGGAGRCNPTLTTIAEEIGASDRQVRLKLRQLEELGLIRTERSTGGGRAATNAYVLVNVPAAPADEPDPGITFPPDGGTPCRPASHSPLTGEHHAAQGLPTPGAIPPHARTDLPPPYSDQTPPTPTPIIPAPPTADHATATAAATGDGHGAPTKPRTKPAAPQSPPALFVLPAANPPPPHVDPWEPLYAAAALDLEGKATAWRHHRTGRPLANYGELAAAIGPHLQGDAAAALEVWRAIVEAKKAETFGDGRPVWTIFSPSNAARLCRRHLQDNPGFAALALRTMAQAADTRPPIGRIAAQRGFTVSRPDTWPADVLAAYPDIAAQWAGAATGTDGGDLTQATDKRYTSA